MSHTRKQPFVWALVLLLGLAAAPTPAVAQTPDPAVTGADLDDDDDGFDDWGLLGLLGLLGLMGRKRDPRDVGEPRRV